MSQISNQQHGQKSGCITAPILDLIIYTPRLRAIISDLKKNDDFRPEGLHLLHRQQIGFFIFALLLVVPIFLFAEYVYAPYAIILLFVLMIAYTTNVSINSYIIPISIGNLITGKMLSVEYDPIPVYKHGWIIRYEFWVGRKRRIENRIGNIEKKDMRPLSPKKGDDAYVFYNTDNPHNNMIYAPGFFQKCCVSRARFNKYQRLGEAD